MLKLMTLLLISLRKLEESKQKSILTSYHHITQPTSMCTLALCLLAHLEHERQVSHAMANLSTCTPGSSSLTQGHHFNSVILPVQNFLLALSDAFSSTLCQSTLHQQVPLPSSFQTFLSGEKDGGAQERIWNVQEGGRWRWGIYFSGSLSIS